MKHILTDSPSPLRSKAGTQDVPGIREEGDEEQPPVPVIMTVELLHDAINLPREAPDRGCSRAGD